MKTEEKAMKAHSRTYPMFLNWVHNPKIKHKESKCHNTKKSGKKRNKDNAAKACLDQCSDNSQSSSGAYVCIAKALTIKATGDNTILDSGARNHMLNRKDVFSNY